MWIVASFKENSEILYKQPKFALFSIIKVDRKCSAVRIQRSC